MKETQLINDVLIRTLIRPRPTEGHKGTFGHALIIAGSKGKMGAAILAAEAALRTGCGLVSVHITQKATIALLAHLPEAMIIPRKKKEKLPALETFNAIGIGPGIGVNDQSTQMLQTLLETYRKPMVIDADGITLLGTNRALYRLLNPQIILTPHPKEFDRLTQDHTTEQERLASQLKFAQSHQVIVVLKGHRTTVAFPDGSVFQNTTGNNGMATGGSGDVLTGIITSLLALGYLPQDAALLGVYLHGYSGDAAAQEQSEAAMIASDIIAGLKHFFLQYQPAVQ